MARPILVVGLTGRAADSDWDAILAGRSIIARSGVIATKMLPEDQEIEQVYDNLFEREQLEGIDTIIADDLARRAVSDDIAYVVPGVGWIGDATVSALIELTAVEFANTNVGGVIPAHVQITDALTLALAQERAPFDAGSAPLDATVSTVVFNLHGQRVTDLASIRLRSIYGESSLVAPNQVGTVSIDARDALSGPASFAALANITARLRRPDGCPWDREQTHESMLDDFASEVTEYAEAVRSGDWTHAAEELGDVLLNVLMQAQIGVEADHFTIEDVLASINAKLVRRHPHVFAGVEASSPEDVLAVWNSVKQQERASRSEPEASSS